MLLFGCHRMYPVIDIGCGLERWHGATIVLTIVFREFVGASSAVAGLQDLEAGLCEQTQGELLLIEHRRTPTLCFQIPLGDVEMLEDYSSSGNSKGGEMPRNATLPSQQPGDIVGN